jgi:hypothetical protein
MPSFLPDVSHHNSTKYKLGRSFCSSYRHNIRNLERPWYGLWCQVLTDLTEGFDSMIVVPQFPLWYIPHDEEEDNDSDVDGMDELDLFRLDADERNSEHGDEDGIGNTTTDSVGTIPDGSAADLYPDFFIIHLLAKYLPVVHPHFSRLGGVVITHQCCPVIMENKKAPSRTLSLNGDELAWAVDALLDIAQDQLGLQCHHFFMQYPHAMVTIAIAAAGDYWTFRTVHRAEIPRAVGDRMDFASWEKLQWPPHTKLVSSESDRRLRKIHEALKSKTPLNLDE